MKRILPILLLFFSVTCFSAPTKFVYNITQNEIVLDCDSDVLRPIASVTKLMTALVVVDSSMDMNEKITYKGFSKRKMSREDLLSLMLVKSDNRAAEALAKSYEGGRDRFILEMNIKAASIGMRNTHYDDPSGISSGNISTARDLALLLTHIYNYHKIKDITSTASYNIEVENKRKKHSYVTVNNTNRNLLTEFSEIEISKTGTTNAAGKCLAMFITRNGNHYAVVILGERNRKSIEKVSRNIIITL